MSSREKFLVEDRHCLLQSSLVYQKCQRSDAQWPGKYQSKEIDYQLTTLELKNGSSFHHLGTGLRSD